MIAITINGKKTEVEEGTTLLEAARGLKVPIPTLCYHKALTNDGNCRLCMTEITINGRSKMVTACNYPVREELTADTKSEKVTEFRKGLLSMMLSRWPNVPIIKEYAQMYDVPAPTFEHPKRNEATDACILCTRCVRACSEMAVEDIIGFQGRGADREVTMPLGKQYHRCIGCEMCANVCPTGAIKLTGQKNKPNNPKQIADWGYRLGEQMTMLDDKQCRMRKVGTGNLTEIMDAYDLLPTHNYKFGSHSESKKINSHVWTDMFTQKTPDGCFTGCMMSCAHAVENFVPRTGPYKGQSVIVDGPEYETIAGCGSNIGVFNPHDIAEMNFYCDTYGIDTISYATGTAFAMECFENGLITTAHTDGLDLKFGNADAALEVLHHMAEGKGFGVIVGQGVRRMKQIFAEKFGADPVFMQDIGMEVKGLEYSEYVSKESLAQQGGFALASKGPQHDEAWLIFMDMVNKQIPTFEDKAEALHFFPNFRTWFGLLGLCKLPWNDVEPEGNRQTAEPHKVPEHLEGYYNFYEGVTGKKLDEQKMITMSEKVYNFQRVFNLRMGYGTREHDIPPYRAVGPVTDEEYESRVDRYDEQLKDQIGIDPAGMSTADKKAALRKHREAQYNRLVDAVYKRRGWTKNGVPTIEKLKSLGMDMPWLLEIVAPYQE